jgi:1-phosphofructokinase family hexose kinase
MAIVTVGFNPAIDRILECPGFHVGGHQKARQLARLASGKAANVSRALAQVSVDSIATGFVGTGELPFYHQQLLAAAGTGRILCHFVEVSGKTRENISILDPNNHSGVETHIRDVGFTVTPQEISLLEQRLTHDLKPGDIAIFSGSLCQGLPKDYIATIIDLCTHLQAQVAIDSNGEPLRKAVQKQLWIIKPNLEELRQLLEAEIPNDTLAIRDAGMQLLDSAELVLISRGRKGAVLLTREGCYSGQVLTDRAAVRTVTCGDHLLAGFIAERMLGRDIERSLRCAMALATARAWSPKLDEIDPELLRQAHEHAKIEKI